MKTDLALVEETLEGNRLRLASITLFSITAHNYMDSRRKSNPIKGKHYDTYLFLMNRSVLSRWLLLLYVPLAACIIMSSL
jgi:hypothetical protein